MMASWDSIVLVKALIATAAEWVNCVDTRYGEPRNSQFAALIRLKEKEVLVVILKKEDGHRTQE